MLALYLITPPALVSDAGEETAMLPPCDVDEGLPFIDDDEVRAIGACPGRRVNLKGVDSVE
ncbi:MAG: hypothetical protein CM15mP79_0750 [Methanobacteriota archaeon]|nr:MAG: hypothetical protein CM15mP79_0750 [Euryarchaeota archaeon]